MGNVMTIGHPTVNDREVSVLDSPLNEPRQERDIVENLSCFFGIRTAGSRRSNASLPPSPKIFSARKKESSYLFGPHGLSKLNHKGIGVQSSTTSKAVDETVRDDDRPELPSPNFGIKYSPCISEATGQNSAPVQERPPLDLSIPPRKENCSRIRNKHRVTLRSQAMQRIDREPWYKSLDDFWHSRDRGQAESTISISRGPERLLKTSAGTGSACPFL